MRRYAVLIILLLLAGCGDAAVKTAVPTATVTAVERPLATATATSIPPTSAKTVTRMPPITSQSTGSLMSTPVPYPSPTPLPPLVWTENVVYVTVEESLTGPVVWSPIENSFLTTNCRLDITKKWQLLLVSAPDFEKTDITPSNFICDIPIQALAWTPDAQHILFSSSLPKDHPNHPSNFGYDNSAIWIADRTGSESRPVNFDEAYGRYLQFTDWLDDNILVYVYYCGGGHDCVVKLNLDTGIRLSTTLVHAGGGFLAGADYVAANNGMSSDSNTTAVAIVDEMVHLEAPFSDGAFMICLSEKCGALPCIRSPCIEENSRFEDWLPGTNTMLVLTWPAEDFLTNYAETQDGYHINNNTPTKLQLWNVDTETITELVKGGVFGRFSHDGRYLAYHTLSPKSQLHILDTSTHEVILSKPSAEPTLHWNGKQFLWSSDSEKLIYRDESENWTFLEVSKDRSTPITLNGGAHLSNPQWSFDASYLSVRMTNEQGWETTVLQVP